MLFAKDQSIVSRIISVNVGHPRTVVWRDREIRTGIFKEPVKGATKAQLLGIEGDQQADLTVHGGPQKAVYAYPSEHYKYWQNLYRIDLHCGAFGENLTTKGVTEDVVQIGDRFRIGSAELEVTRPRFPCYKLEAKFQLPGLMNQFMTSGRSGFYLCVVKEGDLANGDEMELLKREKNKPTVADIFRRQASEG